MLVAESTVRWYGDEERTVSLEVMVREPAESPMGRFRDRFRIRIHAPEPYLMEVWLAPQRRDHPLEPPVLRLPVRSRRTDSPLTLFPPPPGLQLSFRLSILVFCDEIYILTREND